MSRGEERKDRQSRPQMIKQRGEYMKRLIAVLVAMVFCVSLFCPPLAARDHDPTRPLPWMDPTVVPDGDDGGWQDADSTGADVVEVFFNLFKLYGSKYFIIFVPNKIDNSGSIERDVTPNNTDIPTSRDVSTR
jgi:hypothetical protein